jgi:hypothetical protein
MMGELSETATEVEARDVGDQQVIDFDLVENVGYEFGSSIVVAGDGRVVDAAVRFGDLSDDLPEWATPADALAAWRAMVMDVTGIRDLDRTALRADFGDVARTVPHLVIDAEAVSDHDAATLTASDLVAAVAELSMLVERVFRADDGGDALEEWI